MAKAIKIEIERLYTRETESRIRQSQINMVEFSRLPHFADKMRELKTGLPFDFLSMIQKPTGAEEIAKRDTAITEFCSLVKSAQSGDLASRNELNALQRTMVDIFVRANCPIASMFFEQDILGASDQAMITYTFSQEINVKYIGEDGGVRSLKLTKAQQHDYIRMRRLWTDAYEYAMEDINLGTNIADMARAVVDAAWDLAAQIDALAFSLLKTRFGAFNQKSGQINQTYLPHSRIVTSNLPTTNDLGQPADPDTLNNFRLEVCTAILTYYTQWGEVYPGLAPSGIILVPSLDAAKLTSQFNPTGSFHNKVADSVLSNYLSFTYFKDWTIVPTTTIDPAQKFCYPVPTLPIGRVHLKPSMDKEIVKNDEEKNLEWRKQSKVIAFDAPEPWRPRVCRVQYKP